MDRREKNGTEYLRVERGGLPGLCTAAVERLHSSSPDDDVVLMTEGFEWISREQAPGSRG